MIATRQTHRSEYVRNRLTDFIAIDSPWLANRSITFRLRLSAQQKPHRNRAMDESVTSMPSGAAILWR